MREYRSRASIGFVCVEGRDGHGVWKELISKSCKKSGRGYILEARELYYMIIYQ